MTNKGELQETLGLEIPLYTVGTLGDPVSAGRKS